MYTEFLVNSSNPINSPTPHAQSTQNISCTTS